MIHRLLALLIRLFPADFRRTFGADMQTTFEDEWRERGNWRLAIRAIMDTIASAVMVRVAELPTLSQDLRFAFRMLLRAPGFSFTLIMVLAIGTGANSAIFSLVDAALLRPLPFVHPEQLVMLWERPPDGTHNSVAPLNFLDWSEQNHTFTAMAAVSGGSRTLVTSGAPERIPGESVSSSLFSLLGVKPISGRTFRSDDVRSNERVVVLSERLWRSHFGSDPTLVGKAIQLDGEPFTVIGIVPSQFQIFYESYLWTPFKPERGPEQRQEHYLRVLGRLKPGATLPEANADMSVVAQNIARISPETNKNWSVAIEPLRAGLIDRDLRTTTLVLAGVVGFVLLLACANVANLLLAKGAGRSREIAVRSSLGGSRWRIVRQLLTENALIGALGGIAGVLLAWLIVLVSPSFLPPDLLPVSLHLVVDARVIGFAGLLTVVTVLLFGLTPAWHTAHTSLADSLRTGGRTATAGMGALRTALAGSEIAVAVLLVTGAGLLVRTLLTLGTVDPGFYAPKVLTMYVILPLSRYPNPNDTWKFYQAAQREIRAIPGVQDAAFGGSLPSDGFDIGQSFQIVGKPSSQNQPGAHYQIVGTRYFETLGTRFLRGRPFGEYDSASARPVCIVNEELARRYLNGSSPLGALVSVAAMTAAGPKPVVREVVGVIHQVKVEGRGEKENNLEIYVPLAQNPWYGASIALRTAGDPISFAPAVKAAIARVDKGQPVTRIRTMDDVAAESIARPRFRAQLTAAFATLSLILACVGVFGVLAFAVAQRTREFGIRMALGATAADILRLVITSGMKIIFSGLAAGLLAALLLTRTLTALLFGVKPLDPATFVVTLTFLTVVALAACALPALRAARVEPTRALHQE